MSGAPPGEKHETKKASADHCLKSWDKKKKQPRCFSSKIFSHRASSNWRKFYSLFIRMTSSNRQASCVVICQQQDIVQPNPSSSSFSSSAEAMFSSFFLSLCFTFPYLASTEPCPDRKFLSQMLKLADQDRKEGKKLLSSFFVGFFGAKDINIKKKIKINIEIQRNKDKYKDIKIKINVKLADQDTKRKEKLAG